MEILGGPQTVSLLRDSLRHSFKGSYLGFDKTPLGGRQPESALQRLLSEVPRSQGTSHPV